MNPVPDWNQKKQEIGKALRNESYLPQEADPELYEAICQRVGATTNHDVSILISVVQDAIMMARREEHPTTSLDTFRDWLMMRHIV